VPDRSTPKAAAATIPTKTAFYNRTPHTGTANADDTTTTTQPQRPEKSVIPTLSALGPKGA